MTTPLQDIRVVELATWVAAPSATAMMADLGADVVKLEAPGGDPWRHSGIRAPGSHTSAVFELDNRGKRSVVVDLECDGGPELVRRLCRKADVFVTNLTPRRQRKYGLTGSELLATAPRIVHASLTAFGLTGPDADRPGFDNAAYWARTGIMGLIGAPDPGILRPGQGDHAAGLALLSAILAGLRERDRTGRGLVVDASLFAAGIWTIGSDFARALADGEPPESHGRAASRNPLACTYQCSDGRWLALVMPQSDPYWPGLCQVLGHPEWEYDAAYASFEGRSSHFRELTEAIEAAILVRSLEEWRPLLDSAGIIWEPVSTVAEVIQDPQAEATHRWVEIQTREGTRFRSVSAPFSLGAERERVRASAPGVGADAAAILSEYGFSADEMSELAARGALG